MAGLQVTWAETSGLDEDTGHAECLGRRNIGGKAVTDHGDALRWESKASEPGLEEVGGRFTDKVSLATGGGFESHQEGASIKGKAIAAFPDEVAVHGDEVRATEKQAEGQVQAVVGVDAACAAEHDDGGTVVLDKMNSGKLLADVTFDEEEAPLVRIVGTEVGSCGCASGNELVVTHRKAECAEEFPELAAGTDGGVGEEHVGDTEGVEALQRLGRTGDGVSIDVEDTVDVNEEALDQSR